jgi:ferredoxin-thioredoxin reductase catalytic chain
MSNVVTLSATALCGPNPRVRAFGLNGVRRAGCVPVRQLRCKIRPCSFTVSASAESTESTETTTTTSKSLEIMRKFSEQYAKRSGTYFCVDKSVTAVVIKGLAEHKDELGAPLCPCRHYDDKQAEADQGFWNCPCVPMRERKECHCMLFLTEDNDFRGEETDISMEEVLQMTEGM